MRSCVAPTLLIALLLATGEAKAVTIYVDNQRGSDRASGLQPEPQAQSGPVRTVSAALARVQRGGRIVIANTGQPYREMLSLSAARHSGMPDRPLVIEGNGAVVDGTVVAATGAWQHVRDHVYRMQPRRLAYQQLFEAGQPLDRVTLAHCDQLDVLEPQQWALCDRHLYFRCEENQLPSDYALRHAGLQAGLTLYNVQHVRIENLVFQGFQQDGVNAHELVDDCQLVGIEARANGRAGLSVGGVSRVRVTRSNFYDNGRAQVRTEGLAEVTLTDSDVPEGPVPAYDPNGRMLNVDGRLIDGP